MRKLQTLYFRIVQFCLHLFSSKSRYSIHSPFVYTFVTEVLPHKEEAIFSSIKALRAKLRASTERVSWEELGAGSHHFPHAEAKVGELVRHVSRRHKEGALLYRISQYYQPANCLELGTHLGISSIYQAVGLNKSRFLTIEGIPEFAEVARQNFQEMGLAVEVTVGRFEEVLKKIDLAAFQPNYVFIDGNHKEEATLKYFHLLLPNMVDGGIMIFDDIYWSKGMMNAWQKITAHPEVSVSLDLFFFGICFIRRSQAKEHFRLRYI
ncbi:MAG: class I SAM-dependent methyltransferase [Bacteroidota bacterium]